MLIEFVSTKTHKQIVILAVYSVSDFEFISWILSGRNRSKIILLSREHSKFCRSMGIKTCIFDVVMLKVVLWIVRVNWCTLKPFVLRSKSSNHIVSWNMKLELLGSLYCIHMIYEWLWCLLWVWFRPGLHKVNLCHCCQIFTG